MFTDETEDSEGDVGTTVLRGPTAYGLCSSSFDVEPPSILPGHPLTITLTCKSLNLFLMNFSQSKPCQRLRSGRARTVLTVNLLLFGWILMELVFKWLGSFQRND